MAINGNYTYQGVSGYPTPIQTIPVVVYSPNAPTSSQNHYLLGQQWVNTATNSVYQLTNKTASTATWTLLGAGAGEIETLTTQDSTVVSPSAGNINIDGASGQLTTTGSGSTVTIGFTSPSTAPGAFTSTGLLTGDAGITTSGGATTLNSGTSATNISTDASATTVHIATGAAVKTTVLGSTNSTSATTVQSGSGALNVTSTNGALTIDSGTGALGISTDAAATTVSFATGGAAKAVTLGSTNTTSSTTVQAGSGGLILSPTAGNVSMVPATTSSSSASVTLNDRYSCITFTGFTTASGSSQAFTITNSTILATSAILCTVANLNASTNGAEMSIVGLTQAAGSVIVNTKNNGGGNLGSGDNVLITLWVLS